MSKIHSGQLFAILLLSGAWSVMCIAEIRSGGQLLGIGAACLLQLLLSIPMLLLSKGNFSFSRTISSHKWLGFLYILFFLLWGAHGFAQLWDVAPRISLPVSGRLTAAVLITITCLYTCSLGLHALARSAPFVLGFLLLSVLVLVIGAWHRLDTVRLTVSTEGLWSGGLSYFCMSGELAAALILLDRTKGRQTFAVFGYLAAKALLACLVLFLCICAAGRLAALSDYPFFTLTALSQPLQSQRADSVYIIVFVMLYIVHITLQSGVISHLVQAMFPKFRGTVPLSLAVMLLLSWGLELTSLAENPLYGILILVTVFLIPLLFYFIRRCSHETNSAAPAPPVASDNSGLQ